MSIWYQLSRVLLLTLIMMIFFLGFCTAASVSYNAAIKEGQDAAQAIIEQQGASAITIALVDADQVIWSQSFGVTDPITGQAPSDTTLFGIGSVSKMFAAIAVMKLVDQGVIDLDAPLVTYLPNFKMESPEYKNITVRMLLNHSSGFPGTDYRNADIRSPKAEYFKQVLNTLSLARLKAAPGYMNVYCNDGFTVIEALITAKTGKPYAQFVRDEILTPLGMHNTLYPTHAFPDGSYAKASINGTVKPQEFLNAFASGGVYSTAKDMANIAMLFLNHGTKGRARLLSNTAITNMAVDQTQNTFKPVQSNAWTYGLGWDSVSQPGLLAVGFDGWAKGGDSSDYGSVLIVSPKAGLGIIVIGASGFGSGQATALAERILLRALAENGRIAAFPSPLTSEVPQKKSTPNGQTIKLDGEYASSSFILHFLPKTNRTVQAFILADTGFIHSGPLMRNIGDGWFASEQNPLTAFKGVSADLQGARTEYLVKSAPAGYGHYLDATVFAQKIDTDDTALSPVWRSRLSLTWLVVNEHPDELIWNGMTPRLRLSAIPELPGLIAINPPTDSTQFHLLNPALNDNEARMMLVIPQLEGRDLDDLVFKKYQGEEWARFGSYMHRPLASVPIVLPGKTETITIGAEGYAEWRAVAQGNRPVHLILSTDNSWHLYDSAFKSLAKGKGSSQVVLPPGEGLAHLCFFGAPGEKIAVAFRSDEGK